MPQRKRASRGVGDPPGGMRPEEIAIWNELKALPLSFKLERQDRRAFSMLVIRLALEQSGNIMRTQDFILLELLKEFGLTPASRRPKFA